MSTEITIDGATYDGSPLPSADVVRLTGTFRVPVACGSATIDWLWCGDATIDVLWCDSATIDTLTCGSAKINHLRCGSATIAWLLCGDATLDWLACGSATIDVLWCDSATIDTLTCGSAKINHLRCGSATIAWLWCGDATIDTLAYGSAKITRLDCDTAAIGWLDIGEARINGASTAATPDTIQWARRLVADIDSRQLRLDMSRWHGWPERPEQPAGYCETTHCIAGAIQCRVGDWASEPADVLRREAPGLAWLMYASDELALRELRRIAALSA